jgi:hypothetical protein
VGDSSDNAPFDELIAAQGLGRPRPFSVRAAVIARVAAARRARALARRAEPERGST